MYPLFGLTRKRNGLEFCEPTKQQWSCRNRESWLEKLLSNFFNFQTVQVTVTTAATPLVLSRFVGFIFRRSLLQIPGRWHCLDLLISCTPVNYRSLSHQKHFPNQHHHTQGCTFFFISVPAQNSWRRNCGTQQIPFWRAPQTLGGQNYKISPPMWSEILENFFFAPLRA